MNRLDKDHAIEAEIVAEKLDAARVTKDQIDNLMDSIVYVTHVRPNGSTSILVHAFLNGNYYLASGHSAYISLSNFNEELGKRLATERACEEARNKLWELEGYVLYKDASN